ncbi:unnamed protein product [Rotaria sp. Silwood1]|nr:unnamed protein product [Rotaria sp. Silwood1]
MYSDDFATTFTAYMLMMTDIVLNSECTDTNILHKQIRQQIVSEIPDFQASNKIEIEQKIENPDQFKEYFNNFTLFEGETDSVLLQQLAKVREEFKEFFSSEASDWYKDVQEKSQTGEAHLERYPLIEQRRAWMAVRYKLLKEFGLQDQESYHSGIYPTNIMSVPNDTEILWEPL